DRLAELRLQVSPAGDARTQEVSLVQIGEPTGCRLRAEPARRGEKSRRQAANSTATQIGATSDRRSSMKSGTSPKLAADHIEKASFFEAPCSVSQYKTTR